MSTRTLTRLAWAVCAANLALLALSLLLIFLGQSTPLPEEWWFSWWDQAVVAVGFIGAPVLGGLIASRRPGNPYGWLWLGFGTGFALSGFAQVYAAYALVVEPGSLPAPRTVGTVVAGVGWLMSVTFLPFLLLLFPTGRLPSRRWRFPAWTIAVAGALVLVLGPFAPGKSGFAPVENPLGVVGGVVGEIMSGVTNAALVAIFLAVPVSVLSLVLRYRRASRIERQQIKWFIYAAAAIGVLILIDLLGLDRVFGDALWNLLVSLTFTGLYVAVGIAILRYRLYDIDFLINRTLVYGALTATLAAVYFGGVAVTQTAFRLITGQEQQPQLAVVTSTLIIAALFNPLRRRLQAFVDRRFYRKKYDAAQVLEAFSARLRDETDFDTLSEGLVGVVRETVQPEFVSLWLREKGG